MDTNTRKANDHKHWINKELRLRPQIEKVMPFLKEEGFHNIHRALEQFTQHITEYGRMKCELAAMKNYKKRENEFKGEYFTGVPTDADITKLAELSKSKHNTLNNIAGSLAGHYQHAMRLPLPFSDATVAALELVNDYLRHMAKKFDKALHMNAKEMAKRGMDIPLSFMMGAMENPNNFARCA